MKCCDFIKCLNQSCPIYRELYALHKRIDHLEEKIIEIIKTTPKKDE